MTETQNRNKQVRKIAVFGDFLGEQERRKIETTVAPHGFSVQYHARNTPPEGLIDDCEIVYGSIGPDAVRAAKSARWICAARAGVNTLCDESLYRNPDCILSNSCGAYGVTVAEHTVMLLLMLLRRQPENDAALRAGGWKPEKKQIMTVSGSRITVLGTGDLGSCFAERIRAFHPKKLLGVRNNPEKQNPLFDEIRGLSELEQVLPETDILVMCLPDTKETAGLMSAERIALLPKESCLINVGRGTAVDQSALLSALSSGRLNGAALDVVDPEPPAADDPVRHTDSLILTPHVAGNTNNRLSIDNLIDLFCAEFERYVSGKPLLHRIDRKRGY